jgi:hypothetical protein
MILIALVERGVGGRFIGFPIIRIEAIIEAGVLAIPFKAGLII